MMSLDEYYGKRPTTQIFIFNDMISNDMCNEIIELIDDTAEDELKTNPGTNVLCKSLILNNQIHPKIYNYITNVMVRISRMMSEYAVYTFSDCGYIGRKIHGPTKCHTDSMADYESEYIPSNRIRNLTITIALNDDYDGGEFCFPCQNFKIKLKRGQAIAFPPFWTHPHYTNPLNNKTYRYTLNTWMHGN